MIVGSAVDFVDDYLDNLDNFVSSEYVIGDNHFVRNRKMNLNDHMRYILTHNGCANHIAAQIFTANKNDYESITPQAIGKQRVYISPEMFIDINEAFIDGLYENFPDIFEYKDYTICACDGSIIDLPISEITREEFNIGDDGLGKEYRTRGRISCIYNTKSNLILTSIIASRDESEVKLAIKHLENLNQRFDMQKLITVYDRGYGSIELIGKTIEIGSKFAIRLRKDIFHKEISQMKTNDEIVEINLNKNRLANCHDEKLKEKLLSQGRIKVRISIIDIGTTQEILATNLTPEEFTTTELKEIYNKRWRIETGYNRLKNLIQIEEFTGQREIIIKQDFYARIFTYNLATLLKIESEKQKTRKSRKNTKREYQVNFSHIVGIIYINYYNLLTTDKQNKKKIIKHIINESKRELTEKTEGKTKNKTRKPPDVTNKHPGNKKRTH